MNDDHIDDLLVQAARDYNEPGSVPREAMWARIAEARRARVATPTRRTRPVWIWSGAGLAAALLIAAGISIGRRIERQTPLPDGAVATRGTDTVRGRGANTAAVPTPERVASGGDSTVGAIREATRATADRVRRMASAATGDSAAPSGETANRALAYQLVVLQHLAGTEAMITSFRASARNGEMDAQVGKWARELLGTTRLLAASPAANDAIMKRLLEDLELVIVQIVQYTTRGTNDPEELDLIEQSIKRRGVIDKLRSTLPARGERAAIRG